MIGEGANGLVCSDFGRKTEEVDQLLSPDPSGFQIGHPAGRPLIYLPPTAERLTVARAEVLSERPLMGLMSALISTPVDANEWLVWLLPSTPAPSGGLLQPPLKHLRLIYTHCNAHAITHTAFVNLYLWMRGYV